MNRALKSSAWPLQFSAGMLLATTSFASPDKADTAWKYLSFPNAVLATVQSSPACPNNLCPGLGNAFYLPDVNAQSILTGGREVLVNRKLGECASIYDDKDQHERVFKSSNSMQSLNQRIMTENNLTASVASAALTVKATVSAMTGSESNMMSTFHSTYMDIQAISHTIELHHNGNCISEVNIAPDVLKSFTSLPLLNEGNVANSSSWTPYVSFLRLMGSHVMMQQIIGSRFQQWESSASQREDIAKMLEIKACAQVEGPAGGGWSVRSCGGYSKEELRESLAVQTDSKRVILGSSDKARKSLNKDVNQETLNNFIDDSNEGNEAIRYTYKPIYLIFNDIFQSKCHESGPDSEDCNNLQRAVTLQAAYDGWLAIQCPESITKNGITSQAMEFTKKNSMGIKNYQCTLAGLGCKTNDDCHLSAPSALSTVCYGSSCIDQGEPIPLTNFHRDKVRTAKSGNHNEGVNKSCYYKAAFKARCHMNWSEPFQIYQQIQ